MCALPLTRVLPQRRTNSLDAERENFERSQSISISKAISTHESPVKEKHVRSAIIGTFNEKGAGTFWSVVQKLPLQGNTIICWKFCHVLHKVLREGHQNAIHDSQKYKSTITDLGKLWGLLKDGYGRLIQCYCNLLVSKLDFHRKNPRFPGSLSVTDEELDDIGERDVNVFFQLSCEFFDYMDDILSLQHAVFGSLDMSRSNSMTNCGQCRLAPLIPCIQDSSQLYDYTVKVLFKLHAALPPDTLTGHRDRFMKQFKALQLFYLSASNLQYFKHLIHVPLLPENPPNFLVASDLSTHVSPVVILPPHTDTPENETVDMNLVDTTVPKTCEPSPDILEGVYSHRDSVDFQNRNGSASPDTGMENQRLIGQLQKELEYLRMEIQRLKIEYERKIDDYKRQMVSLEAHITELDKKLLCLKEENDELRSQLSSENSMTEMTTGLAETEKKAKVQEEKFHKMKEVYNKLREEHIALIRGKAELDKQVVVLKASIEKSDAEKKALSEKVELSRSQAVQEEKLQRSENMKSLEDEIATLKTSSSELEAQIKSLTALKTSAENSLENLQVQCSSLENCLDKEMKNKLSYLNLLLSEGEAIVRSGLEEFDKPAVSSNRCQPERFLHHLRNLTKSTGSFMESYHSYSEDSCNTGCLLPAVVRFSHLMSVSLTEGKMTSNATPNIDQGDKLARSCLSFGNRALQLFQNIRERAPWEETTECFQDVVKELEDTIALMEAIVPNMTQDQSANIADVIDKELKQMDLDIERAAQQIQDLLMVSRTADSGIKLEVNSKILDSCTSLMQAIKMLVHSSKELQQEIISQGRGSASMKDFYSRNHQWAEGLISAAKVVGLGANFLLDAANKVVSGQTKFEELVVASQEIAAATAQLVIASRVKAAKGSEKMAKVSLASKKVAEATGQVVATAKSCAEMVEESEEMDFSKLTLHQAKRLEVESQVRVLELESMLEKERVKLAGLRKQHYHLAGASEGWDVEDIPR